MSSDFQKPYYDAYWEPTGHAPQGYMFEDLEKLLRIYVQPGYECLDVGCGDALTIGPWLAAYGGRYRGVDVSASAIDRARAAGFDAQEIDDASRLPFGNESFDAVFCIEVLEHLFNPILAAEEIFRVLRPGGVLIATVPNVAYWRRRLELGLVGRWNPVGDDRSVAEPWRDPHIRFFTVSTLGDMLGRVGFTVEVGGHGGAFVRDIPWFGMKLWRSRRVSRFYRYVEARSPTLFALRLHVVAIRPVALAGAAN